MSEPAGNYSYEYKIGPTSDTMINIESLTFDIGEQAFPVPPPVSTFTPVSKRTITAGGSLRGDGYPIVEWRFNYLPREAYIAIIEQATNETYGWNMDPSYHVHFQTRDQSGAYLVFSAFMEIPEELDVGQYRGYSDLVLRFTHLIYISGG